MLSHCHRGLPGLYGDPGTMYTHCVVKKCAHICWCHNLFFFAGSALLNLQALWPLWAYIKHTHTHARAGARTSVHFLLCTGQVCACVCVCVCVREIERGGGNRKALPLFDVAAVSSCGPHRNVRAIRRTGAYAITRRQPKRDRAQAFFEKRDGICGRHGKNFFCLFWRHSRQDYAHASLTTRANGHAPDTFQTKRSV